jgi:hypothetical protein
MKVFLSFSVASLGLLLLTSCASTGTAYEKAPPRHETVVTDKLYIATVEHFAKQRGTRVVWVNMPKKRVVETVASSR